MTLRRIVIAVDFSDMSADVLRFARDLLGDGPGEMHLLHVVPDPLQQPWTVEAVGIDFAKLQDDWLEDAHTRLKALIEQEGLAAASVTPVVLLGRAPDTIVAYANQVKADAIVMGTHGYGPVRRFILGSTAERVLRHAACPVLTIPHATLKSADAAATEGAAARS
jgi:nucleotide-binding universal stress UspA family protein